MSKRVLVKESGIGDFFQSFFKAKADNKESDWLQKLRRADPKLADVWSNYDKALSTSMKNQKATLDRLGIDSSHIDSFVKKYGIR
jgi:arginyl-tRNA synthetase